MKTQSNTMPGSRQAALLSTLMLLIALAGGAGFGCNTSEGVAEDVEDAADAIEDGVEDAADAVEDSVD